MKKTTKKLLTVLCASCMAASVGALTACNTDLSNVKDPALSALYEQSKSDLSYEDWLKKEFNGKSVVSIALSEDGSYYVISYSDGTTENLSATQPKEEEIHVHSFGDLAVVAEPDGATDGYGYKTCACGEKQLVLLKNYILSVDEEAVYYCNFNISKDGESSLTGYEKSINIKNNSGKVLKYTLTALSKNVSFGEEGATTYTVVIKAGESESVDYILDSAAVNVAGKYATQFAVSCEEVALGTKDNPYTYSYSSDFGKLIALDAADGEIYFAVTDVDYNSPFALSFVDGIKITQLYNYQGYFDEIEEDYGDDDYDYSYGPYSRGGFDFGDYGFDDEPTYSSFVGWLDDDYYTELKSGAQIALDKDYITKYIVFKASATDGKVIFNISSVKGSQANPISLKLGETYTGSNASGVFYTYTAGSADETLVIHKKVTVTVDNGNIYSDKESSMVACYDASYSDYYYTSEEYTIVTLKANTTYTIKASSYDGASFEFSIYNKDKDYKGLVEDDPIAITGDSITTDGISGITYYSYTPSKTGRISVNVTGNGTYSVKTGDYNNNWVDAGEEIIITITASDAYSKIDITVTELQEAISTVTITDNSDDAIDGVSVKVMNGEEVVASGTTDKYGKVELTFIPSDSYKLVCEKDGYNTKTQTVQWSKYDTKYDNGYNYEITMYIDTSVVHTVTVKGEEGVNVSGLTVEFYQKKNSGATSLKATVNTDESGVATAKLDKGISYEVKVINSDGKVVAEGKFEIDYVTMTIPTSITITIESQNVLTVGKSVTITLDKNNYYNGIKYTFTSENGGNYVLSTTSTDAKVMIGLDSYFNSSAIYYDIDTEEFISSYSFSLNAGESITFYMSYSEEPEGTVSYDVTVSDENGGGNTVTLGDTVTVTLDNMATETYTFTSTDDGKYKITVVDDNGANACASFSSDVSGVECADIYNCNGKYEKEFTLAAGETITLIMTTTSYGMTTNNVYTFTITEA